MYLPKHFSVDRTTALRLMQQFPFASVISMDPSGEPFVNHLPLLAVSSGEQVKLRGHMALRNPQVQHFRKNPLAWVTFHGPSAYISPQWYPSGHDVPTWNYAVVQVKGSMRLIEEYDGLKEILAQITDHFEAPFPQPWEFSLPEDLQRREDLLSAIVGFEMEIEHIEAKFKLSQNRCREDQTRVVSELEKQKDRREDVASLMRTYVLDHPRGSF